MLLTGTFPRTFDEKLRIAIPKPLKDELALQEGSVLYVTPGTDGSLAIYSPEVLEQLAARLAASSPTGRDVRTFARLFYAQAFRADIDKQGRVRLSQELVNLAGIAKEAILVGAGDHLELWDKARWETYLAQNQPQYDEIAEAAFQPKL